MSVTLVEVDEELLSEARLALRASADQDIVTQALLVVVAESRKRRSRALGELRRIADEDGLDFSRVDELDR